MKRKKGFTLVELIVTVGLLALLALVIILNLRGTLKKQKEREYIVFTDKIKSATNVYLSAGKTNVVLETDEYIILPLEDLEGSGLISMTTLIDPQSNLSLNDSPDEKKYVKIYKDQSDADFIEYPIKDLSDLFYNIEYVLMDGTGCENMKVLHGSSEELCQPTKENADFKGWYINSDYEGGTAVSSPYKPNSNVKLYAKWQHYYAINYNIEETYNCEDSNIKEGESIKLCTPTRNHYVFKGWYDGGALTEYVGNSGDIIIPSKSLDLYPKWERKQYTITFDYTTNGGTKGTCSDNEVKKSV